MTRAQLLAAVKMEARITSGTNLDAMIYGIIDEILVDYCNKFRYYELLTENEELTLVDAQQVYAFPEDFQSIAVVRFGRGASPTSFRQLIQQTDTIRQTYNGSNTMYFRLVAGPALSLWPYANVLATDQLFIDYYINPLSIFVDDNDEFPIPRLQSAVKKDTIARLQRFHSGLTEAQLMDADGNASFVAGLGAG